MKGQCASATSQKHRNKISGSISSQQHNPVLGVELKKKYKKTTKVCQHVEMSSLKYFQKQEIRTTWTTLQLMSGNKIEEHLSFFH